jgi:tripartite ATP-independent transporter DctM subunit
MGVPVAVSLGVSALLTGALVGIPPLVMVQQMFAMLDSFTLVAIPLFLLVGIIMEHGEITDKLVEFSRTMVGHIRGGLGHVNIFSNMIMAGISGSANADAAALGSIMIPAMKKEGYTGEMAAAINACASTMGPIIPPSMLMIVYGAYGGLSVAALFLAGAVPGVLVAATMMITLYFWTKKNNVLARGKRASLKEIWRAFRGAALALIVPVIIIAGVLGGKFTATESGMIAAVYSLIITTVVYKTVKLKTLFEIIRQGLVSMSAPMLCSAGAGAFGYMMAYLQIPNAVLEMSGPVRGNYYLTLIFITVLFIILGCFMDAIPAIMIFLPIVQSLSGAAGLDPLHVGILVVVVLCFGFVTPPYGLTMLLSASIAKVNSTGVVKACVPFYCVFLLICVVLVFFPDFILFIPRTFLGA